MLTVKKYPYISWALTFKACYAVIYKTVNRNFKKDGFDMKRIIVICLALLVVLSVVGCSKTDSYSLTIKDNFPIVNELKSNYQAGEEVTIQLGTVTEQYYILSVNGEEQQQTYADMNYTYFTFAMPGEDVTIIIDTVSVDIPSAP